MFGLILLDGRKIFGVFRLKFLLDWVTFLLGSLHNLLLGFFRGLDVIFKGNFCRFVSYRGT